MSSTIQKKPRVCKCGHLREAHMKNPKSKLQTPIICKNCPCSKYLNRIRPDKLDKIGAIMGPVAAVCFAVLIIWIITTSSNLYTEEEKELPIKLDITQGEFMGILYLMLLLVLFWIGNILFDPLSSYMRIRKRVSWPVQNNDNTQELPR